MPYRVEWVRPASRAFERLPSVVRARIERAIDALTTNPRPSGSRSVVSGAGDLRIRVGDYRVLYEVDDASRTVLILKIAHRSEAYR